MFANISLHCPKNPRWRRKLRARGNCWNGKPNCAIRVKRVDEETVGALLFLLEMQTAYAGELYGINAFDQPGVELGKNFTYGLMGRRGYEAKRKEVEQASKPNPKWVVST